MSNRVQEIADAKYEVSDDKIREHASELLKHELEDINSYDSVKHKLEPNTISTIVGTFAMDGDPPSQIYEEYVKPNSSIPPNLFYSRCSKSITLATMEHEMVEHKKATTKTTTAKGRIKRKGPKKSRRRKRNNLTN